MRDVTKGQTYLHYAPDTDEARDYFEALTQEFCLAGAWPQIDHGDLGARMARAIQSRLNHGHSAAILIGSDCPDVTAETLHEAIDALDEADLVVGPADDGGYYLIGAKRLYSELFYAMEWSHDAVLDDTLDRADVLGLEIAELDELGDLDNLESLRALKRDWMEAIQDDDARARAGWLRR